MNAFQKIYYAVSVYATPDERRVGKFIKRINEHKAHQQTTHSLTTLLQSNAMAVTVWCEYRYKGYAYLRKKRRKVLYANAHRIEQDFYDYLAKVQHEDTKIRAELQPLYKTAPHEKGAAEKLRYMYYIMQYFAPRDGRFTYRPSSTIGELLKNPANDTLKGDCNQIATLYIYLYAKKYPITDLQLATYPGHVALHMYGIDIETTNGTFADYTTKGRTLVPVYEIASINLLDVPDAYYKTHTVEPKYLLESGRLAYVISSQKRTVTTNLRVLYRNAVLASIAKHAYDDALTYAKQSHDSELVIYVQQSAIAHYCKEQNFPQAYAFARGGSQAKSLYEAVSRYEANSSYSNGDYGKAIKLYDRLNDNPMIQQCYSELFYLEQQKLGSLVTADDVRAQKRTIQTMARYAKKSHNHSLIAYAKNLQKYL